MLKIYLSVDGTKLPDGSPLFMASVYEPTGNFVTVDTIEHHFNTDIEEITAINNGLAKPTVEELQAEIVALKSQLGGCDE